VSQSLVGATVAVKQYSTEVLITIVVLLATRPLFSPSPRRRQMIAAGVAGSVGPWLSFPVWFVLAGIGLTSFTSYRRGFRERPGLLAVYASWIVSMVVVFLVSMRPGLRNAALRAMWQQDFLPVTRPERWGPWAAAALSNLGLVTFSVRLAQLGAVAVLVGAAEALRRGSDFARALAAVVALTFLASCLQLYPFVGRFLFFAVPVVLLLVCGQIGALARRGGPRVRAAAAICACAALTYAAASLVKNRLVSDPAFDDPRGAFAEVRRAWRPGDVLYASAAASPSLLYYQPHLGFESDALVTSPEAGETPDGVTTAAAMPTSPSRVWCVYFWPTEAGFGKRVQERYHLADRLSANVHHLHTVELYSVRRDD